MRIHRSRRGILLSATVLFVFASESDLRADLMYSDFSSTAGLNLVGSAAQAGSNIRLTTIDGFNQSDYEPTGGAAWATTKQHVLNGFDTTYQFRLTNQVTSLGGNTQCEYHDCYGRIGADGFALVLQNQSDTALGAYGRAKVYGTGYRGTGGVVYGIVNNVAIELDTWSNEEEFEWGFSPNNIKVQAPGLPVPNTDDIYATRAGANTDIDVEDGEIHTIRVVYAPRNLLLYLDDLDTSIMDAAFTLDDWLDLPDGTAWVGFTAATAGSAQNHDILNWSFTEVPEPASMAFLSLCLCLLPRRRRGV